MAKILLVLPPHKADLNSFLKPYWSVIKIPPIGLFLLKAYLESKGHEAKIADCRRFITEGKNNDYVSMVLKKIKEFKPDVIGINAITAIFNNAKTICNGIKEKYPQTPVILGGVHPSVEPQLSLEECKSADAVCIGAGEEVCLDILNQSSIAGIKGLMVQGRESKEYTPRKPEMNLDKYPFLSYPEYYSQVSVHLTGWISKAIYTMTSRSCPYSCKFCASDWSKPARFHSTEYTIEMTKELSKNVNEVLFSDDTIALNRVRLENICEGFISNKIFYPYTEKRWVASLRANQVDKGLLSLMKASGCQHIGIGIESGSNRMLEIINKKTTVEANRQAVKTAKEVGLGVTLSFIIGMPEETKEDMEMTINFMKESYCNGLGVGTFRPLPGSPFYKEFRENGSEEVKEYLRDWDNLGNFSIPPKHLFCQANRTTLTRMLDKAYNLAYANQWNIVSDSLYNNNKELVKNIAKKTPVRVCYGDNYPSHNHKKIRVVSFNMVIERTSIWLYLRLPSKLQRQVKLTVERLTRIKSLKWLLWRYSDTDLWEKDK